MKPDWQNKSFAKGGSATGSTTMHSKLKVGMSSLHSKIGAANSNMPQAPKPAVRKMADGGFVGRGKGMMSDEEFAKQQEQGAKNLESLRSAAESIRSFFTKEAPASSSNVTGESGMSASDEAKKAAMSGGAQMPKTETEEPRRSISDYQSKAPESETVTTEAPAPEKKSVSVRKSAPSVKQTGSPPIPSSEAKMTGSPDISASKTSAPAPTPAKSPAPVGKTYRTMEGKMARSEPVVEKPLDQQWGLHNVIPNAKYYAGKAADAASAAASAISKYETPAERRSRLAKEGK